MRKLVVLTFVSLDGVMQAPGAPDEDRSGGFKYGGWTAPFFDEASGEIMAKQMGQPFDLLLGRKTYDIFAGYWPQHDNEVGQPLNAATKYVVTDHPFEASWDKTVQIHGDVVTQLRELKAGDGPMLQVHGSGNMIQTLLEHDLVDELWLKTFPVTLGQGKRLWGEGVRPAAWKLTESTVTPSGIIAANYVRDGEVKTGTVGE
ncbi:MAG TPA: dihydrofolate reductase family protein [Candidatus Saccharimonadia bacterium]|nr:dihydrofolate reductase family protein [Candidatus Saccharimonadia bacterium]